MIFLLVFMLLTTGNVYGYIDSGTGSFILQMLIGGIAFAVYAIRIFWTQIKTFFTGLIAKFK